MQLPLMMEHAPVIHQQLQHHSKWLVQPESITESSMFSAAAIGSAAANKIYC